MQIFDYLNKEGLLHLIRKIMGRDVDLTQAEYDALPESKNSDGKNYYIYDSDIAVTAGEVGFDGSTSGSTAANSQQALDELFAADKKMNESLENVNSNLVQISYQGAWSHNAIYRGKNLGTSVTEAQYAAISSGTFDELYIGDYWVINGVTWRIAAFDYYLHCGDTDLTTHHAVIVPDSSLYNHGMNDTNTTEGGYAGSKMYREGLESAKTTIKAAFSGHVLSHRIYLTNAVANGKPSAGAWCDSEVDLMCEEMVYGGGIFRPTSDGSTVPANYRVEKSQLPLFAHRPDLISNRITYWLRDVVTAAYFAVVYYNGYANYANASLSLSVRPAFCIKG